MKTNDSKSFDVPIDGLSEQFMTMEELMTIASSFATAGDYENAKDTLDRAISSGYIPAKIVLARLLKDTPQLHMKQKERFARAEKLYSEVLNLLDLPRASEARLTLEQAFLYEHDRTIAFLGALLKARRLGCTVHEKDIERCRKRLARIDINTIGQNPEGCYVLGSEIYYSNGPFHFAEFFLREASESDDAVLAGKACLCLANLYEDNAKSSYTYRIEATKYYQLAEKKGFPEVMTPPPGNFHPPLPEASLVG